MNIVWSDELATGHEKIDKQHKKLFRLFNDFQRACRLGKGVDVLSSLLSNLEEYVRSHMALEEHLQIVYEYPGYLKHKNEHEAFIQSLRELEEQLKARGTTPALLTRTNMTLVDWLTRHFTWTDRELARYLRNVRYEGKSRLAA
jgi:hemerythrin-like metal-binding protein